MSNNSPHGRPDLPPMREVVLGRGSSIWRALSQRAPIRHRFQHAIGHAELGNFAFTPSDRVWVLAYSKVPQENQAMLDTLRRANVAEIVYITSSSTVVMARTHCYAYPRAKKLAEDAARAMPHSKILTFGLVVGAEDELPAGRNAATTLDEIAAFFLAPHWPVDGGQSMHLLRSIERPFDNALEHGLYRTYSTLMRLCPRHPCLLRPIDLILRALGMRWYGYTFLSNQLWTTTMTS